MIAFSCPRCRQVLSANDGAVGKLARCARCGATMPVPAPKQTEPSPAQEFALDEDIPSDADPEPVPADAKESPARPRTASDATWEGQLKQSKMRMFLIAGGGVGGVAAALLLILALTTGGKPSRPRAQPGEPPPDVSWLREPQDEQGEKPAPAPGRKGRRPSTEEEEDPNPRPRRPPPPVDDDAPKSAPSAPPADPSPPPSTDGTSPTQPLPVPPPDDKPAEGGKEMERVSGLLRQLDRTFPAETRIAALEALGRMGPKVKGAAGKAVAEQMLDPNTAIGRKAKAALERIDPAVAEECTTIIVDKDHRLRSIEALTKLGKDARSATPVLLWVVENHVMAGSDPKRPADAMGPAIRALVAVAPDDERVHHRFVTWIGAAEEDVRLAAVSGFPRLEKLSKKTKQDAVPALVKVLKLSDVAKARAAAADALGELGADALVAERDLDKATADSSEEVRRSARRALDRIRGER
jgi:HEAT repeat protein